MLTEDQACVILDLLEVATEGHWPRVAAEIQEEHEYTPEEISAAWAALEKVGGRCGGAPGPEDFRLEDS